MLGRPCKKRGRPLHGANNKVTMCISVDPAIKERIFKAAKAGSYKSVSLYLNDMLTDKYKEGGAL